MSVCICLYMGMYVYIYTKFQFLELVYIYMVQCKVRFERLFNFKFWNYLKTWWNLETIAVSFSP